MNDEEMQALVQRLVLSALKAFGAPKEIIDGVMSGELIMQMKLGFMPREEFEQMVRESEAEGKEPDIDETRATYQLELDVKTEVERLLARMKG
jgi:hypothetical protein